MKFDSDMMFYYKAWIDTKKWDQVSTSLVTENCVFVYDAKM